MSDTDSFIEEVSEEVRRDRLFAFFRRYGWIAVTIVVLLVGGAAVREYLLARDRAAAEALGDQLLSALQLEDPAERASALSEISAQGDAAAVISMLTAAGDMDNDEQGQAIAQLEAIALQADLPQRYRDLAALKRILLLGDELSVDERRVALSGLAAPGAPYRLLAEEQIALIEAQSGDAEAAIARLRAIIADQNATQGLQSRASDVIFALGGTVREEQ